MFKLAGNFSKRNVHNKTTNSLRIHRSKPVPCDPDRASTSFAPNFSKANAICMRYREKIDEFNAKICSEEEKRVEYYMQKKGLVSHHISTFKKALDNGDRRIIPIGSCANGLFGSSSDIDLVLMPYSDEKKCLEFSRKFQASQAFRNNYMKAVVSALKRAGGVQNVNVIENARVPIVKLNLADGMSVDIQFNNPCTVGSSLYIKTCAEMDPRFPTLIGWMKNSFARSGLKGNQSAFSTYHTTFLAIHFLNNKNCGFNLLPNLTNAGFEPSFDWKRAADFLTSEDCLFIDEESTPCPLTAGELVVYMADYYAQMKLENISLHMNGDVSARTSDDPLNFFSPYFPAADCKCTVSNAAYLLPHHFKSVIKLAGQGMFLSV